MINKLFKTLIQNKIFLLLFIVMCFWLPYKTNAANLSTLPSSTNILIGNTFTVKVFVNTLGKSINNTEATIKFPTDMLNVVSITKSSSIFSMWVEEPSFSNSTGQITFNGGVPNPGYTGQNGYLMSITFKARKQGTAFILFSNGAVRENDGLGTDILVGKFGSVIKINSQKVEVPKKIETPKTIDKEVVVPKLFNPYVVIVGNQNVIKFDNQDDVSKIDYYTIQIDNNPNFLKVKQDELINNEFNLPVQNGGNHVIDIVAFYKDGSYIESVSTFMSPSIFPPILSLNPQEINKGESAVISGKTDYPNSRVNVILELEGKEIKRYTQTTKTDGSFSITTDKIKEIGLINIWAENIFSDTVKSTSSERVYLKVNEIPFIKITFAIFYPLLWLIVIFIFVSLLFMFIYLGWHKFFGLKKKLESESKQTAIEAHKAMMLLKEELGGQLQSLEKVKNDRSLNEKEEAIFSEIEKNIDVVDTFIEKKLKR